MKVIKKKEGFEGQKAIVLPHSVIHTLEKNPITAPIYITDIGYYPDALYHYRERQHGCKQHILIFCVGGKGWFKIENRKYDVFPENFFLIPADTPHSYGADVTAPWSIYWIHFKGTLSINIAEKLVGINRINSVKSDLTDDRLQLFEDIYQTLDMGYSIDNLQYSSMCLWHFLSSFLFINNFKHSLYKKSPDLIDKVIEYFKNNLSENFTLKQISEKFGFSVSHFSYLFRKRTGYAPLEYFSILKIQRACQYLDLTDMRIKEIASELGYDDPYYFSRVFHKIMNISPVDYRKKQKG